MVSSNCSHRDDAGAEVGGDLLDDLLDGVVAHVGLEEHCPQFVEEGIVDQPALGLEEVADVGLEKLGGLLETLLEAIEKPMGRVEGWGFRVEVWQDAIFYGTGAVCETGWGIGLHFELIPRSNYPAVQNYPPGL